MSGSQFGLCGGCAFQRIVPNTRGSTFSLCERSATDPRYPRYPRLPVVACDGFAPRPDPPFDKGSQPQS